MLDHDELIIFATRIAFKVAREANRDNIEQTKSEIKFMPPILRLLAIDEIQKRDAELGLLLIKINKLI